MNRNGARLFLAAVAILAVWMAVLPALHVAHHDDLTHCDYCLSLSQGVAASYAPAVPVPMGLAEQVPASAAADPELPFVAPTRSRAPPTSPA